MGDPLFVVVSGPPGSGKSTLACALAPHLCLPLIAKDTIKEALMSVLPVPDVRASRDLGRGAVVAMLAVASDSTVGGVLEAPFQRTLAAPGLRDLPGRIVELFCRCERAGAAERYRERAATRHPGHLDLGRTIDELWNDEVIEPVAGGWPVLEGDTNAPVDLGPVIHFVRTSAG